jgi:2'-5' RNA ligase
LTEYDWESPGATALVVVFPEAEPAVGRFRRTHTPSGAAGMAAHATLMAPFIHASGLTEEHEREIARALAPFRPFSVELASFGRFEHVRVLYLVPDPGEPFVVMSEAVLAAFPEVEYPPEGASGIVPHVTVASRLPPADLDRIEAELGPSLPIQARADSVVLVERDASGRWTERRSFPLSSWAGPSQPGERSRPVR